MKKQAVVQKSLSTKSTEYKPRPKQARLRLLRIIRSPIKDKEDEKNKSNTE
jgi:hypothetical protein